MTKVEYQIIIDSREQRPYRFAGAISKALTTGDYSVASLEHLISIERKSLGDLLACIGGQRDRFERELEHLAQIPFPSVVIEALLAEVLRGSRYSALHWNSVLGSLCAWSVRHRLPLWFCDNRRLATMVTERLLIKAAKYANGPG